MLNFLSQKNREQITKEYFLRVSIFFLSFTLVSVLILTALFIPSFFFVKYKNDNVTSQLELIMQKSVKEIEDPIAFVKKTNLLSVALSNNTSGSISNIGIIDNLVLLKNKDIRISSIVITDENGTSTKKIVLSGVASTREGLTSYEKDIKIKGDFESVIFPVSSFIKSSNSDFIATLIYKNK